MVAVEFATNINMRMSRERLHAGRGWRTGVTGMVAEFLF